MALADTALESIVIPASVEEIGIGAFFTSYKLKKIQFRSYSNWWGNCASLYLSRNMQDGSVITFADDGSMLRFTKADDWHVVDDVEPMAPENDDFDEDTVSTQEATSWLTIKNVCWAGVATAFLCYATFFLYKKGLRAVFRLEKIPSTTLWRINFRSFYRTQKKVVFCTF
jgi:hypothetical protein